jgi:diguanylate cyclase (GGDEF)-like protein
MAAIVGRGETADVQILDPAVSRKHVCFFHTGGQWKVEDLGSQNGTYLGEVPLLHPVTLEGSERLFLGRDASIRVSLDDAQEQRAAVEVYAAATRDPLTDTYNRRYLSARLEEELAYAHRHHTSLSVLMIDIDHFKAINDTHGHLGGDVVLRVVGATLRKMVRTEDVVARYGGEEFVIVARDLNPRNATIIAERLRRTLAQTRVPWNGKTLSITASIGIASHHSGRRYRTVNEILGVADSALYEAKRTGRNRCVSAH